MAKIYGDDLRKINVYFKSAEYEQIKHIAEQNRISVSKLIRMGVNKEMNKYLSHTRLVDEKEILPALIEINDNLVKVKHGLMLQKLDIKKTAASKGYRISYGDIKRAQELIDMIDNTIAPFDQEQLILGIANVSTAIMKIGELLWLLQN